MNRCHRCLEPEGHEHLPPCIPSLPIKEENAIKRTEKRREVYEQINHPHQNDKEFWEELIKIFYEPKQL
jgi:hypothetical protein